MRRRREGTPSWDPPPRTKVAEWADQPNGASCKQVPPPCISYALVRATVGVGTVLIWYPPPRRHVAGPPLQNKETWPLEPLPPAPPLQK